jgi:hypothetical protein
MIFPIGTYTQVLPFGTNFTWDGTSDLLVDVCWGVMTNFSSSGAVNLFVDQSIPASVSCMRGLFSGSANQCSVNFTGTSTITSKPAVRFQMATPTPCAGMPTGGTTGISGSACVSPVIFNVTGATADLNLTYSWETSATNVPASFAPISPAQTGATLSLIAPTNGNWYRRVTTCTNSGQSAASTAVQFSGNSFFPVSMTTPFTENFEKIE